MIEYIYTLYRFAKHNLPPQGDGNTVFVSKKPARYYYTTYPHKGTEIFWEKREYHKAKKTQLTPTRGRKLNKNDFEVLLNKNTTYPPQGDGNLFPNFFLLTSI